MSAAGQALTLRLDALGRQVQTLGTQVTEAREVAERAHRVLEELTDRVAAAQQLAIAAAEASGHGQQADDPEAPAVRSWLVAPTEPVLTQLLAWVSAVLIHYPDAAAILGDCECWVWHPWVVEELLALQGAWVQAYVGPQASPVRAVDWHERHRPAALTRIGRVLGDCGMDAHTPGGRCDHRKPAELGGMGQATGALEWWITTHTPLTDLDTPQGGESPCTGSKSG